eukprot:TRINITY_DN18391_c0_g3_i1.p2 TRINITY_DN18391_c0_g3~~TRINITY_DN18391_c0_g3_i1.p2  ORF type:complete len:339 (+),score=118.36 TRINITY_DN18391_c0_g3_i1:77-1093(+)
MAIPLGDIKAAAQRIAADVHRTPVLTCEGIDRQLPDNADRSRRIFFKCENLQKVGAFKARGALNAIIRATEADPGLRDVVTHSSGNHAQAIAWAARRRGLRAHIVMPSSAPEVKRAAVRDTYGARVYDCAPTLAAREATAERVIADTGAVFIHPYNDPRVQEGQGTCGLEFVEQTAAAPLDAVVIAVGGGGMFSGMASAIKALRPGCRVYAAEPQGADDAARSLKAGKILPHLPGMPRTIADGLLTTLGSTSFPRLQALADGIITVSEAEIAAAMRLTMERLKVVVEPSAAVPLAAVLSDRFPHADRSIRNIGVIVCGGNVDLSRMAEYLALAAQPRL